MFGRNESAGATMDPLQGQPIFDELEEFDFASRLLEITDESELNELLHEVIQRARQYAGRVITPKLSNALTQSVKRVTSRVLPVAARVSAAAGPRRGAALGRRISPQASQIFGLELEGLSPEDQEMEVARRVIRLAGQSALRAASAPQRGAQAAVGTAAKRYAPGLDMDQSASMEKQSGRWKRQGRVITVFGV